MLGACRPAWCRRARSRLRSSRFHCSHSCSVQPRLAQDRPWPPRPRSWPLRVGRAGGGEEAPAAGQAEAAAGKAKAAGAAVIVAQGDSSNEGAAGEAPAGQAEAALGEARAAGAAIIVAQGDSDEDAAREAETAEAEAAAAVSASSISTIGHVRRSKQL